MADTKSDTVFKIGQAEALKGGALAGEYLDGIGKTDLASLTEAEWTAFCMKLVGGAVLASIDAGGIYGDQVPF